VVATRSHPDAHVVTSLVLPTVVPVSSKISKAAARHLLFHSSLVAALVDGSTPATADAGQKPNENSKVPVSLSNMNV